MRAGKQLGDKRELQLAAWANLPATLYTGEMFDNNVARHCPARSRASCLHSGAFCSSASSSSAVREIDQKLNVTNATLVKVPFDLAHWQKVAAEKYPHGLPKPFSSDPTQWLFNGHPKGSDQPLHVAVARLLGYQWPRQTGSSFPDCPALGPDGLEKLADDDGIVCLSATKGEAPAAERLRELLARGLRQGLERHAALNELLAPGGLRRRDAGGLAAQRVLRAALRALPPSPVHLAHLGRPQETASARW